MRVPLLVAAALVALPLIAFRTGARSLLRGMFDLTPASLFMVTVTALAASGGACVVLRNDLIAAAVVNSGYGAVCYLWRRLKPTLLEAALDFGDAGVECV